MVVEQDELLTVEEVAALVKVSVHTVRDWLENGQLKGMKYGASWRVLRSSLFSGVPCRTSAKEE